MEYKKSVATLKNLHSLRQQQLIPRTRQEVFSFFETHSNLAKLTPPSLCLKVLSADSEKLKLNARYRYKIRLLGVPLSWTTLITRCEPPYFFEDVQLNGPYAYWKHVHQFEETNDGTLMTDEVHYQLPLGWLGNTFGKKFAETNLRKVFDYRRENLKKIFK